MTLHMVAKVHGVELDIFGDYDPRRGPTLLERVEFTHAGLPGSETDITAVLSEEAGDEIRKLLALEAAGSDKDSPMGVKEAGR